MAKQATSVAKRTSRVAIQPENVWDDFSSSDDDFSDDESIKMAETEASSEVTTEPSGHKVQLQKTTNSEAAFKPKERAVIYIGQLPKQFQEKEMRRYFSQFGDLLKVRLARDRRSGASKHHGWVEFAKMANAKVAAETMNNYLLFGKMMKVEVVQSPPANLFPANYRENFTEYDWRSAEYKKETAPKPLADWKALQAVYESERASHLKHLKTLGFDYSMDNVQENQVEEEEQEEEEEEKKEGKGKRKADKVTKPAKKARAKK